MTTIFFACLQTNCSQLPPLFTLTNFSRCSLISGNLITPRFLGCITRTRFFTCFNNFNILRPKDTGTHFVDFFPHICQTIRVFSMRFDKYALIKRGNVRPCIWALMVLVVGTLHKLANFQDENNEVFHRSDLSLRVRR